MTFTETWNEKFQEFVDGEKGVARVMEHRKIDENTEIYCLAMEGKAYQVRVYAKSKNGKLVGKIVSKHEKSTEAIEAYRELRNEMKPDFKTPKKVTGKKKASAKKKTPAKKPATEKKAPAKKKATKKPAKKASGKKKAVTPADDFFD